MLCNKQSQYTIVKNKKPVFLFNKSGVLQGWVFGTLLLLIYINQNLSQNILKAIIVLRTLIFSTLVSFKKILITTSKLKSKTLYNGSEWIKSL